MWPCVCVPSAATFNKGLDAVDVDIFLTYNRAEDMIESEPTIFSQDYLFTILWIGNTFLALLHDLLLDQRARAYCDSHWRTAIIEGRGIILRGRQWHRHDCRTNGAAAVVNTLPIFRARVISQGILYPSPVTPPHKERLKMQGTMIMSASVATPPISDLPHSAT